MPPPTILVCDDDPGLRLLLRLAVAPRGYRVVDARDGSSCIEQAARLQPDLILIDAGLSDMTVGAVVGAVRDDPALRAIPLLIATSTPLELEQELVEADGILVKPFRLERLVAEIDRLLARPQRRGQGIGLRRLP